MHAAQKPRPIIIVAWMSRIVLGGFFLLAGVVLVSSIFRGTGIFAIPGVVSLAVGLLAARGARVEFRSDELVIRQTFRTRRIPRGDILGIGVTKGSNAAGLPWRVPFFRPRKGPIVAVEEIRSLRTGTIVDRVVDVGREWAGLERNPEGA